LRHAFFAERAATKIDDLPKVTATQKIECAAVIGCGTMGGGIAMNFANAGIPVTVLETEDEFLQKGVGVIRKNYAASVAKGRISQEEMDGCMSLISGIASFDQLGEPDVVIEAIFEKMDVKKELFAKLDGLMPAKTILATNTSTLDVNEIASATAGECAGRKNLRRDYCHHHGACQEARQGRRAGWSLRRLCRQPHAARLYTTGQFSP
jgi:3-hydroxyacyl-CoA dehydrogenase